MIRASSCDPLIEQFDQFWISNCKLWILFEKFASEANRKIQFGGTADKFKRNLFELSLLAFIFKCAPQECPRHQCNFTNSAIELHAGDLHVSLRASKRISSILQHAHRRFIILFDDRTILLESVNEISEWRQDFIVPSRFESRDQFATC